MRRTTYCVHLARVTRVEEGAGQPRGLVGSSSSDPWRQLYPRAKGVGPGSTIPAVRSAVYLETYLCLYATWNCGVCVPSSLLSGTQQRWIKARCDVYSCRWPRLTPYPALCGRGQGNSFDSLGSIIGDNSVGPVGPCLKKKKNERGEPTASYRWTGWVWEITGWSSRLQENYRSF